MAVVHCKLQLCGGVRVDQGVDPWRRSTGYSTWNRNRKAGSGAGTEGLCSLVQLLACVSGVQPGISISLHLIILRGICLGSTDTESLRPVYLGSDLFCIVLVLKIPVDLPPNYLNRST